MAEMELVMIAVAPDANLPVKIEFGPLAPGQGAVHRIRDESSHASTVWGCSP